MLSGESQGMRGPDLAADTWLLVLHPRLASTRSLERFRNQVRLLSAQTYQGLSLSVTKSEDPPLGCHQASLTPLPVSLQQLGSGCAGCR